MVTVYFITNRNPSPAAKATNFGSTFSKAGVDDLRFGSASVTKASNGNWGVRKITTAREKLDDSNDEKSVLGSRQVFEQLQARMRTSCKDSLIFVHGYNVSFKEALITGAKLAAQQADTIGQVAVFSWPSDGRAIPWYSYKSDRTDARASGPAFARAFIKSAHFIEQTFRQHMAGEVEPCHGELHLLAHSMGNYVLRNALQEIRELLPNKLPRLFTNIFLAAADEDFDCFEHDHKLGALPAIGKDVHVYFNRGDAALRISDGTKGQANRLGTDGPKHPLNVPGNVTNIDVSELVGGLVEHSYFVDTDPVIGDIGRVLAGRSADQHEQRRYVPSANRYVLLE